LLTGNPRSSGIQVLPAIKNDAKTVINFIREPTWVAPPLGQGYTPYSEEERKRFANDPEHHLQTRKEIEQSMNKSFGMFHSGSMEQAQVRAYMESLMKEKIKNPKLEKLLIPEWSVGCRRITPGTNYLESLGDPNVEVVFGEITQITKTGVVCNDGSGEHPVEVLVCATGFDTTFKPRFPLIGWTGEDLADLWKG
jgi:cyclohexanone monooxygenase